MLGSQKSKGSFKAAELQTVQLDAQGYLVLLRLIANMYEHPSFHYDETRPEEAGYRPTKKA